MPSDSEQIENIDSEEAMQLKRRIEWYLKRARIAPTRFGRETVNDPNLVFQIRHGRQVTDETAARIHAWLDRARDESR
jgi:hypothetical protein